MIKRLTCVNNTVNLWIHVIVCFCRIFFCFLSQKWNRTWDTQWEEKYHKSMKEATKAKFVKVLCGVSSSMPSPNKNFIYTNKKQCFWFVTRTLHVGINLSFWSVAVRRNTFNSPTFWARTGIIVIVPGAVAARCLWRFLHLPTDSIL